MNALLLDVNQNSSATASMSLVYLPQEATKPQPDALWSLTWASARLVSGGADGVVRVHDPADLDLPLNELPALPLAISALSSTADGRWVLATALDGTVSLLDVEAQKWGDKIETARDTDIPAYAAAIHPKGEAWAWVGRGMKVGIRRIYDIAGEKALGGENGSVALEKGKFGMVVKFSPDGKQLAVGTEAGHVSIIDVETTAVVATYASHAMCVRALDWSPDSQWLYTGSDDARIVLHDVRAGGDGARGEGAVAILQGHQSWVLGLAASPDSKLLASVGADKLVKLWDVGQRACVSTNTADAEVWGVAWQAEYEGSLAPGKQFAIAGDDKNVSLYRAAGAV